MTGIGNRVAPRRFLLFAGLLAAGCAGGVALLGWRHGLMAGFDLAALTFILSCWPLIRTSTPADMRAHAAANDANRALMLAMTGAVTLVVLATIASELGARGSPGIAVGALVIATVAIAWAFSNLVYALHYAHLFYAKDGAGDAGGLTFPDTAEPDYGDFVYFAFTIGMTFQTSDVAIGDARMRRVATLHGLAAFVYNLGILAFTINVLGN